MEKSENIYLYHRNQTYIPRIAAVHDLCGYGNCSLGVAIPVLSAAGIDVCPVPTAFLSSHTKYAPYTFNDTTDSLSAYLDAWSQIGVELDAIYSGFLGAPQQVGLIRRLYHDYPDALKIVDPVMGDAGRIYPTYDEELCRAMGDLSRDADVLTPNLTEAALLTEHPYTGQSPSKTELTALIDGLIPLGAKVIVLKGIEDHGRVRNYVFGANCELSVFDAGLLPYNLHGTGDLYCSCLTAAIFSGKSLADAVRFATDYVRDAMQDSQTQPEHAKRGVSFELRMGRLAELLHSSRSPLPK